MDRKKNLEVCLVIVTGMVILYLIKEWVILLYIAILTGLAGIFWNKAASWISIGWYKIADILGAVISKVILGIVYYVFLFPVAILFRLFGQNKQAGAKARNFQSLWNDRGGQVYSADDLKNPW